MENAATVGQLKTINIESSELMKSAKSNRKVLIVEDEPTWQILIERALKLIDPKIEVHFSKTAVQACEALNAGRSFDLIVSDYRLGANTTGLDLWDRVLEERFDIPFVMLSVTKRQKFASEVMEHQSRIAPRFVEKCGSVRELSIELGAALTASRPGSDYEAESEESGLLEELKNQILELLPYSLRKNPSLLLLAISVSILYFFLAAFTLVRLSHAF